MDNLQDIQNKKWFKKWWGILILFLGLLVLLLIISFIFLVFRFKKGIELGEIIIINPIGQYSESNKALSGEEAIIDRAELESEDNPSLGTNQPVMTIVAFSDFNCPYCAIFYSTLKEFVLEYPEQVKVIFRDFPLGDIDSAMAANCAWEQDRFWEMHDKLFSYQDSISESVIKNTAEDLRLDMDLFNDCYDHQKYQEEIQKDLVLGIKAGVEGTPTLFINGEKFVGVIPQNVLEQILYAIEYGE